MKKYNSITITSDGGFVMMGTSSYFNQSNWTDYTGNEYYTDIWLMRTYRKCQSQPQPGLRG